jgi:hypothetical protein
MTHDSWAIIKKGRKRGETKGEKWMIRKMLKEGGMQRSHFFSSKKKGSLL